MVEVIVTWLYAPKAAITYRFLPAAVTAAWIWRLGCVFVPGFASFPVGETKTASASVPSIRSQFESTNSRSGTSRAPGWIAALVGAQSCASSVPSRSESAAGDVGVGVGGVGVGVGVG